MPAASSSSAAACHRLSFPKLRHRSDKNSNRHLRNVVGNSGIFSFYLLFRSAEINLGSTYYTNFEKKLFKKNILPDLYENFKSKSRRKNHKILYLPDKKHRNLNKFFQLSVAHHAEKPCEDSPVDCFASASEADYWLAELDSAELDFVESDSAELDFAELDSAETD